MKRILALAFIATSIFAEMKTIHVTPDLLKDITIIDIRTKPEWKETGIVKNSIPITFFDAFGRYDAQKFLSELDKHVKKDKVFAIICRTGNRTTSVGKFLSEQGYKVINLDGGVVSLANQGYKFEKYTK